MSGNFLRSAGIILLFSAIAFAINLLLISGTGISMNVIISFYVFFLVVNIAIIFLFDYVAKYFLEKAGFVFIGFVFLKAIAIFAFLAILQQNIELGRPLMLNFALTYLCYLFLSIYLCLQTLKIYQK